MAFWKQWKGDASQEYKDAVEAFKRAKQVALQGKTPDQQAQSLTDQLAQAKRKHGQCKNMVNQLTQQL
eukprot:8849270-Pyramimonas_sp.AAC.1